VRRRVFVVLVVLVVILPWFAFPFPGLVAEQQGDALIYRFNRQGILWEGAAWMLAFVAGVFLTRSRVSRPVGLVIVGFALIFLVFALPERWFDRVVITPKAIEQNLGPWFAPTPRGFRYADVESIAIEPRPTRGHAGPRRAWLLRMKDGSSGDIDPGSAIRPRRQRFERHRTPADGTGPVARAPRRRRPRCHSARARGIHGARDGGRTRDSHLGKAQGH